MVPGNVVEQTSVACIFLQNEEFASLIEMVSVAYDVLVFDAFEDRNLAADVLHVFFGQFIQIHYFHREILLYFLIENSIHFGTGSFSHQLLNSSRYQLPKGRSFFLHIINYKLQFLSLFTYFISEQNLILSL